jgi:hypothetical protein
MIRRTPISMGVVFALTLVAAGGGCCSVLADREPADAAARWGCAVDGDCVNSCGLGAVNRHWFAAEYPQGDTCEDGCANQISAPPRCIDGGCVAFDVDGHRVDYCTRKLDD